MKNKSSALVIIKNEDGSFTMMGKSLNKLNKIIKEVDEQYLIIGEVFLEPKRIYKKYKLSEKDNSNEELKKGALDLNNYKEKIL